MNEREKLLKRVMIYCFAMDDAGLFLDTHPDNVSGLNYYNKYKAMFEEAKKEYESKYGPLMMADNMNGTCWDWVKDPWPWENTEVN